MQRHTESVHVEKTIKCDECTYTCKTQTALRNHMKNIHGEKKHQCHVCSGFYVSAGRLRKHMSVHTKNITCDKCGKGFAEENFLMLHTYRIHVEDKVGEQFILTFSRLGKTQKLYLILFKY